jgi:hypothetical protein
MIQLSCDKLLYFLISGNCEGDSGCPGRGSSGRSSASIRNCCCGNFRRGRTFGFCLETYSRKITSQEKKLHPDYVSQVLAFTELYLCAFHNSSFLSSVIPGEYS